jgi:hypothetical protein
MSCRSSVNSRRDLALKFGYTDGKADQTLLHRSKIGIDLEEARRARILRACEKKYPKLAAWQSRGARTILVLEDDDIQNTGDHLVADALLRAEQSIDCERPDEIYLVTTFSDLWFGHVIRVDDKTYFDFTYETQQDRFWEIQPNSLISCYAARISAMSRHTSAQSRGVNLCGMLPSSEFRRAKKGHPSSNHKRRRFRRLGFRKNPRPTFHARA